MLIKQLSVFVENAPGRVAEITAILGKSGVDMRALSLADTAEFGILRLITDDPDKAADLLRAHDFIVKQTDVLAAILDDRPGGLTQVLEVLAGAGIAIEYMYAFVGSQNGHAVVVLRPDDVSAALAALQGAGISLLQGKDLAR